ncbi:1-acyl-sn-glycerol-3-phosphate acyltransferase [Bizionia paragorgiae]|jgi:1-acyl-sn-glycerol-3-phosphate acyltransferase|uniref:1-acyl-sn-glycerol-3-phosphate acyltransferase n=1 Tax=Bizionia paragorgiae TaxID=283786 RepID=UPI00299E3A54|nr:1-acyl-sn-glycerol-3-phosphate acyltransferase [Bizionia paragorgiae]MDX1270412.1 1-acyl-sn-glycerol-3-phosphate acyltransferase [Bizionia paragorgiae]
MRKLAQFLYFKVFGWKIVGNSNFSKDTVKKSVIIAAPHTSYHDFFVGICLRKIVNVKTNFIGKKELFKWPFGLYFKSVGGVALDRTPGQNKVEAIAKLFHDKEEFRLTLAPEGTRGKVDEWKTGFYYIAKEANVPIIMFTLDFQNKQNKISEPFYPTDDTEADLAFIKSFFKGVVGKVPEYS